MSQNKMLLWSVALTMGKMALAQPCDLYASGNTPCVAAHSTTRALYDNYNGGLYQVQRQSDGATMDVYTLGAGGVANAGSQDNFCNGDTCYISIVYDQTGNGNDLYGAPGGGAASGADNLATANAAPITLNGGQAAYGLMGGSGIGYRQDNTNQIPTGNDAQSIYVVLDGTNYNNGCCFDYGK